MLLSCVSVAGALPVIPGNAGKVQESLCVLRLTVLFYVTYLVTVGLCYAFCLLVSTHW